MSVSITIAFPRTARSASFIFRAPFDRGDNLFVRDGAREHIPSATPIHPSPPFGRCSPLRPHFHFPRDTGKLNFTREEYREREPTGGKRAWGGGFVRIANQRKKHDSRPLVQVRSRTASSRRRDPALARDENERGRTITSVRVKRRRRRGRTGERKDRRTSLSRDVIAAEVGDSTGGRGGEGGGVGWSIYLVTLSRVETCQAARGKPHRHRHVTARRARRGFVERGRERTSERERATTPLARRVALVDVRR